MGELTGIVRFTFHDAAAVEAFKRLSAECMAVVRAEDTGTLQYDTYFNADQSQAMVIERFTDSAASCRTRRRARTSAWRPGSRSSRL